MKKILTLFIVALMMINFCSCSNSAKDNDINSDNKSTTTANQSGKNNESDYTITYIDEFYEYYLSSTYFENAYARFKASNDCYGYVDSEGNIVIEPIYEEAQLDFDEDVVRVKKDGVYMYIDRDGETIFIVDFDCGKTSKFENGYFYIETVEETVAGNISTLTYYNDKGKVNFVLDGGSEAVVETPNHNLNAWDKKERSLSYFNEDGYAVVTLNGVNKFIDEKGSIVTFAGLNDNYEVKRVQGSYAIVDNNAFYIDYRSKKTSMQSGNYWGYAYDLSVKYLGDGYYATYSRANYYKTYTAIYKNGKRILKFASIEGLGGSSVKDVSLISEGHTSFVLYLQSTSNVFFSALIDEKGDFIIEPTKQLQLAQTSYYVKDGGYAYTDYECYRYSFGFCKAKDTETGLFGYIDLEGNWVIEPQYTSATDFCGLSKVAVVNGGKTIINSEGEVVFTVEKTSE